MRLKHFVAFFFMLAAPAMAHGQADKEEKQELQQERKAANQDKVDVNIFRRQILSSQEYSAERRKIPALQKASKGTVKIVAYVDSTDTDDPAKLTGYIQRVAGDNTINVYELTFSRISKKITLVKLTGEADDNDNDETADAKKPASKQTAKTKKKKDEDDEDDEQEEKANSKKQKKDKDEDD